MKTKRFLKWIAASLTALMLALGLGFTALAYVSIDNSRETSLTVQFEKEGAGFANVQFRIYRVAEVSDMAEFTLTGDFAGYPVSLEDLDSSGWRALAQTLDAYVGRDSLAPFKTAVTDAAGKAAFEHLPVGLYLVTGDRYEEGDHTYIPEAFMACLPGLGQETDEWIYDMTAACKYNSDQDSGEDGSLSRKVLKVWNDDGHESKRPESIRVQLLKDGQVYDTVTLNAENNWRHTWSDLDKDSNWEVTEYDTPSGYTVSVDRQGITFVMTNTRRGGGGGGDDDDDGGGGGDDDDDGGGGGGNDGGGGDDPEPLETILDNLTPLGILPVKWGEPILPQTGMLWWPVPLLAVSGALLFLTGWRRQRHGKQ